MKCASLNNAAVISMNVGHNPVAVNAMIHRDEYNAVKSEYGSSRRIFRVSFDQAKIYNVFDSEKYTRELLAPDIVELFFVESDQRENQQIEVWGRGRCSPTSSRTFLRQPR